MGPTATPRPPLRFDPTESSPNCPIEESPESLQAQAARSQAIRRVFWITLGLNFMVAIAKGAYSSLSGSVTLGADAFHSTLDGAANVLALVGMHLSAVPASARHPYGRRKIEIVAALGIGVLVAVSLIEVASGAVESLRGLRAVPSIGWAGFAVILGSIAVNAFVTRYEHRKGRELGSPLLTADAHHTQADLYASGAVLLSFLGARQGWAWADGVCGLVVVAMVGHVAWSIFRDNVPMLIDTAILAPGQVRDIAFAVPGVAGIHRVRSRGTRWAIELDLHAQVEPLMTVAAGHQLARDVECALRGRWPELVDVTVHIEPGAAGPPAPEPP